jgi:hypothetical protein
MQKRYAAQTQNRLHRPQEPAIAHPHRSRTHPHVPTLKARLTSASRKDGQRVTILAKTLSTFILQRSCSGPSPPSVLGLRVTSTDKGALVPKLMWVLWLRSHQRFIWPTPSRGKDVPDGTHGTGMGNCVPCSDACRRSMLNTQAMIRRSDFACCATNPRRAI